MFSKPDVNHGIILFGRNVRRLRKEKGLTMQQLANQADIELSQIYRIETGKINPKLSTVFMIAKAFEIKPEELFNEK